MGKRLESTATILGLRRRVTRDLDFAPLIRKGLPANAVAAVAKHLDMSVQATAESLGLGKRAIVRRIEQHLPLDAGESERVVRLARVLAQATDVLGTIEKARRWLAKENRVLGATPLSLLDTDVGTSAVFEELGRIEEGVFA